MKVLTVATSLKAEHGGSGAAALAIADVVQRFAGVTVVTTGAADMDGSAAVGDLRTFPRDPVRGRFARSRDLGAWLERSVSGYDLAFINSVFDFTARQTAAAARRAGVPYLLWPHGSLDPFDLQKHTFAKTVLTRPAWRSLVGHAEALVFTARREAERSETFGVAAAKHVVALPVPVVVGGVTDAASARRSLGLPSTGKLVLFLGRVNYKKGLPLLLRALDDPALRRVHLVVAGRGEPDYERSMRRTVGELGMDDRVHWLGWLNGEQKAQAFRAADCFALVSDNENFGIAVVEAVRAGCPVVISDEVYIADELRAARAALVTPRRVAQVATCLELALEDPGRALAPAAERIRFANDRWAPSTLAPRYEALCASARRDGGPGQ